MPPLPAPADTIPACPEDATEPAPPGTPPIALVPAELADVPAPGGTLAPSDPHATTDPTTSAEASQNKTEHELGTIVYVFARAAIRSAFARRRAIFRLALAWLRSLARNVTSSELTAGCELRI
jgi:hypothetical protein